MTWLKSKQRSIRRRTKTIGLNLRGRSDPEIYRVCQDVFGIVEKMLSASQALGPFSKRYQFELSEVRFILQLLGAHTGEAGEDDYSITDLWISEE